MHAHKHVCTYKRAQRLAPPARTSKLAEASIGQWLPVEAAISLQVSQSVNLLKHCEFIAQMEVPGPGGSPGVPGIAKPC